MFLGRKTSRPVWAILVLSLALFATACGPSEEEVAAAARVEEWTALQDLKAQLLQQRDDLAALQAQLAAEPAEGEEPMTEEARAELQSSFDNLDFAVQNATADFGGRLVNFINDDPIEQGIDPTESQVAALRMKASEDLLIADEYGVRGGDWARAIAIAQEAQRTDPTNPEVLERLAHYESMRYMTEERLANAENGMNIDEVKAAVGVPSRGNDREFEGGTRRAFYYLKSPQRDAAAVYFRKSGDEWSVYKVDFNALEGSPE